MLNTRMFVVVLPLVTSLTIAWCMYWHDWCLAFVNWWLMIAMAWWLMVDDECYGWWLMIDDWWLMMIVNWTLSDYWWLFMVVADWWLMIDDVDNWCLMAWLLTIDDCLHDDWWSIDDSWCDWWCELMVWLMIDAEALMWLMIDAMSITINSWWSDDWCRD